MTETASNPTREQLRLEGFDLIDERLQYLLGCLKEALVSTGETELLPFLPWSGHEPEIGAAPEGLPQLYSIGFQLLNMVEERVAAQALEKAMPTSRNAFPVLIRPVSCSGSTMLRAAFCPM